MIKLEEKFTKWYEEKIYRGYKPYLSTQELEILISKTIDFYSEYESNIETLISTLSEREKTLFEKGYRSETWTSNKELSYSIKRKELTYEDIEEGKNPFYKVYVNPEDGLITGGFKQNKLSDKNAITIEELLNILDSKYKYILDYTEIKEAVYNYNIDIELRNKVLDIIYKNILKQSNYKADLFANDINTYLSNEINKNIKKQKN